MAQFDTKEEAEKELAELNRDDKTNVHSIIKLNKDHPSGKKYQVISLSPRVLRTLEKM